MKPPIQPSNPLAEGQAALTRVQMAVQQRRRDAIAARLEKQKNRRAKKPAAVNLQPATVPEGQLPWYRRDDL